MKKMKLGMEIILISIIKLFIVYSFAAILGIILYTFVAHFSFVVFKRYSFGLHASTSAVCTLMSFFLFVAVPLFANLFGLGIGHISVVLMFTGIIVVLICFAPADTNARPLVGQSLRKKLKMKTIFCGVLMFTIALIIPDESVKLMIVLGGTYQSVSVMPLTYKILGRSVRNYEKFELSK